MKIKAVIIFLVLLLVLIACDNKRKDGIEKELIEQKDKLYKRNKELSKDFPIEENILDDLDYIFDQEFDFDKGVVINKIGLLEKKDNLYEIVLVLGEEANFEKIQGMAFYILLSPSDSSLLVNEKDIKSGYIKAGVKSKIKKMGDKYVVINKECRIVAKTFKAIKFFFYDIEQKEHTDYLVLNNISLK